VLPCTDLNNQSIAVIFKTGQELQKKITPTIPEYQRDKLQILLAITRKILLQKLKEKLQEQA
jgi:hypothetical protein